MLHLINKNLHIYYTSCFSFLLLVSLVSQMGNRTFKAKQRKTVKFMLDHKFEVAKFGQYGFNQSYDSPIVPLIHKNVCMYWMLKIYPNGTFTEAEQFRSHFIVCIFYGNGPKETISPVSWQFDIILNNRTCIVVQKTFTKFRFSGASLGNYEDLVKKNWLNNNMKLHIQAKLEIPIDAFDDPDNKFRVCPSLSVLELFRQEMVNFMLDHKFEVAKFVQYGFNQSYDGPIVRLVHNNVCLYWMLKIYPNGFISSGQSKHSSNSGLQVAYTGGPKVEIPVSWQFYVLHNESRRSCCAGEGYVSTRLRSNIVLSDIPVGFESLVENNYLTEMDSVLHIQVDLNIPIDAFDDPNKQYSVCHAQPDVSKNFYQTFFREDFKKIRKKVVDGDHFKIVSHDKQHFWVHKHIMMKRSPVFKTIFNSDAGKFGRIKELCLRNEKYMSICGVSGVALHQILQYMYMGQVHQLTDDKLKEIVKFASVYFVDDLKDICENKLLIKCQRTDITLEEVIDLSLESEKYGMKKVKECCMSYLAKYWLNAMKKGDNCIILNRHYHDKVGQKFLKELFHSEIFLTVINE